MFTIVLANSRDLTAADPRPRTLTLFTRAIRVINTLITHFKQNSVSVPNEPRRHQSRRHTGNAKDLTKLVDVFISTEDGFFPCPTLSCNAIMRATTWLLRDLDSNAVIQIFSLRISVISNYIVRALEKATNVTNLINIPVTIKIKRDVVWALVNR